MFFSCLCSIRRNGPRIPYDLTSSSLPDLSCSSYCQHQETESLGWNARLFDEPSIERWSLLVRNGGDMLFNVSLLPQESPRLECCLQVHIQSKSRAMCQRQSQAIERLHSGLRLRVPQRSEQLFQGVLIELLNRQRPQFRDHMYR